ncbi:MAG: NAD(P)-dependent oxidoreductase [Stutzerimonas stutzeri]|nr:MAG: NAD(P)-dependent oxidoreductase [Stutzerimonas stutzeri]
MNLELDGKVALVTGSSSGIGAAIARLLSQEGATVIVHGRNTDRTEAVAADLRSAGARAMAIVGDLSSDLSASNVANAAIEAFGRIDILVNNAGGSSGRADPSWFSTDTVDWIDTYQANVLAAVRLIRVLVPVMRERGWGRIINIATGAAITPTSAQPDYAAAKAAMLNMSLSLSKALGRSGVTSNTISPGMIRTKGLRSFLTQFAAKRGWGNDIARAEEYVANGSGQTVSRIGEADDIAFAVAMIASPRSDFVNGTNYHVDGGITPSLT